MLEQLAPIPILAGSLCYSVYLYGTRTGRDQNRMRRAAGLALALSGLGFAILYWATTGLGHDRDGAIRFTLATILWGGLVLTVNRQPTAGDARPKSFSIESRAGRPADEQSRAPHSSS